MNGDNDNGGMTPGILLALALNIAVAFLLFIILASCLKG